MSEFKSCPFCGETPEPTKHYQYDEWQMIHRCPVIGPITLSWRSSLEMLAEQWNRRAEPEKVEPVTVAALEAVWCHGYSAGHQDGLGCGHPMSGRCPHTSAHELEYHRDDIMALAAPQQEQK